MRSLHSGKEGGETIMILYKYVPFAIGKEIIEHNTVLFSQPKTFNDPFDVPFYPDESASDPVGAIFGQLRTMVKCNIWAENTGILSLTRTPANALMWAHYADKHQGMVIGIDVEAAGFTDEQSNLIPAQYGSVVYVSRRVTSSFASRPTTGIVVGATHHFPKDHYEKLQRVFLHKPLSWSYEEEVRVIKSLHGLQGDKATTASGTFSIVLTQERILHLYSLPGGAIREVYFGIRADLDATDAVAAQLAKVDPSIAVFEAVLDDGALSVGAQPYVSQVEATRGSTADLGLIRTIKGRD